MFPRFLREELHVGFLRDALGSELTNSEIAKRELALDKEIIQIIQMACKADKLQRAMDAAALLHHTASFDMAIKVADFYKLGGLQDKLQLLKAEREDRDRLAEERESRMDWRRESAPIPAPQPRAQAFSSKPRFEEFSATTSIRKALAPVNPAISSRSNQDDSSSQWGSHRGVAAMRASEAPESNAWDNSYEEETSFASSVDVKRKRDAEGYEDIEEASAQKRRATLALTSTEAKGSKTCTFLAYIPCTILTCVYSWKPIYAKGCRDQSKPVYSPCRR